MNKLYTPFTGGARAIAEGTQVPRSDTDYIYKINNNTMNDELEVRKFPAMGGYDVTIVNKNDILKTIDDNIIDKEIAYEIITSLELSCQKYVSAGDTAGIPYIGKIKERLTAAIARENKEALNDAREVLDKEHYIAFKHALFADESKRYKYNKVYKLEIARVVSHNRRQYWNYVDTIGEVKADIMFHGIAHLRYSPPCEEQI